MCALSRIRLGAAIARRGRTEPAPKRAPLAQGAGLLATQLLAIERTPEARHVLSAQTSAKSTRRISGAAKSGIELPFIERLTQGFQSS